MDMGGDVLRIPVVQANRFEILDPAGEVRGFVACGMNGTVGLELEDAQKRARLQLTVTEDGIAELQAVHSVNRVAPGFLLQASQTGATLRLVGGPDGSRQSVNLDVDADGMAAVRLDDTDGTPRMLLALATGDLPLAHVYDQRGMLRLSITAVDDGAALLKLHDAIGEAGLTLRVSADGTATIEPPDAGPDTRAR